MILVLDGSLGAPNGNTSAMVKRLVQLLQPKIEVHHQILSQAQPTEAALRNAKAFVFATGTYWDSWGSPLQKFLEDATHLEGSDLWMGKPAATLVSMHSVGGKEVLSRLQGVQSTLGLLIPPMSGMVYSLANHLALKQNTDSDLWCLEDLETIAHNLLTALGLSQAWKSWPVSANEARWL